MASTMTLNEQNIPPSALYTAATWSWGGIDCADLVTPRNANDVFHVVNACNLMYRVLNPRWHSLRHTLLHRHIGIDCLLRRADSRQVIEIGAGFSPRCSSVSADPTLRCFEVDLPPVVAAKRRLLETTAAGQRVLSRPNFRLLEGDVSALEWIEFGLQPSFVITEGLMMYFDRVTQMRIWQNISRFIGQCGGEYVFDYLPVPDQPLRSQTGRLLSKVYRSRRRRVFPCDERSRHQIKDDLHASGFHEVEMHNSTEFAPAWNLPYADVSTRVILYRCRV